MRSYKEIADIVREQGDAILERRRIRAQRIKRISCAVSGLCAAVIIGTAVWHNSALNKAPNPDFGKIPAVTPTETTAVTTETSPATTASTAVTEVKTTSAKAETVITSAAAQTTAISASQTVTQAPATSVNTPAVTTAARITGTSEENVQTTTLAAGPGNTSVGDPHSGEEIAVITPVTTNTASAEFIVTTVSAISARTTTVSGTTPEGPVTTSNTGIAEIFVTTVPGAPEIGTTVTEVADEEMIKEHFSEISFSRRNYTYDRSVDYKPDLTIYMPFDDYLLQAGDGSSCTAKTQLYMPETEEKNHLWVKFDKKAEYCLYILNN